MRRVLEAEGRGVKEDESDLAVREAERRLIDAVRQMREKVLPVPAFEHAKSIVWDRLEDLERAEEERAATRSPRLRRPGAVFVEAGGRYWCVPELIEERDAEWAAMIKEAKTYDKVLALTKMVRS